MWLARVRHCGWILFFAGLPLGLSLPGFLLLALTTPWWRLPAGGGPRRLRLAFHCACAAFALCGLVSAALSASPSLSLVSTAGWLAIMVVGLNLGAGLDFNRLTRVYLPVLAGGTVLAAVSALRAFLQQGGRVGTVQADFNAMGSLMLVSGLLLLGFLAHAWRHGRVWPALCGALGIGAATAALLLTQSRASLLVYGAALLAFGLRSWRTALAAGVALIAAGAALVAVPSWGARLLTAFQVQENMDRIHIWRASWHMLRDHPWFGIGGGTFVQLYPEYRLDRYQWPVSMPHNLELNVAVQLGMVGLALFAAVLLLGAGQLLGVWQQRGRPQRRFVYAGALFAVAALLVRDQVDITLFEATVAAPFWVLGGLLLAWPRTATAARSARSSGSSRAPSSQHVRNSVPPGGGLPHEPLAGP